ncbi:MAG: DUF3810 family protein, partial [Sphingobacteriales bacterium]
MPARTPLKTLFRDPFFLFLVLATAALQWFSASAARVERGYSQGIYPAIGRTLRILFGWLPFSFGDLLYFAAGLFLLFRVLRLLRWLFRRQLRAHIHPAPFVRTAKVLLIVYLLFQGLWGLNYSRQGIAVQAGLRPEPADTARLGELALLLQERLCTWGERVDTTGRPALSDHDALFRRGVAAYQKAKPFVPFFDYRQPSIKPSLYGPVAHLFGFSGYYN